MGRGRGSLVFAEVALRVVPRRVVHECFTEQHLDLVVAPALCWQGLEEHDDALEHTRSEKQRVPSEYGESAQQYLEIHLAQLLAPPDEERRADI